MFLALGLRLGWCIEGDRLCLMLACTWVIARYIVKKVETPGSQLYLILASEARVKINLRSSISLYEFRRPIMVYASILRVSQYPLGDFGLERTLFGKPFSCPSASSLGKPFDNPWNVYFSGTSLWASLSYVSGMLFGKFFIYLWDAFGDLFGCLWDDTSYMGSIMD